LSLIHYVTTKRTGEYYELQFLFDETFHDRKITINSAGVLNTFTEDKNDSYIGVFWGCENSKLSSVTSKLCALEKKYIDRYGLSGEFKSTIIKKKNFNFGVHSFNQDAFDFYGDLFGLLEGIFPIIHVNVVSKVELLIRNIFDMNALRLMPFVIPNPFYYSITKFFLHYHTPQLIKALYSATKTGDGKLFQEVLLNHLNKIASTLGGIERKKREAPALRQLYEIVALYDFDNPISEKYDFVYFQNFAGLMNLLDEKKILPKDVIITIDKEEKTYYTATQFAFNKVKQLDSTESIQVRIADHLCGYIGRMMHALMDDKLIKEDSVVDINCFGENDLVRKHLLSPDWFDLQPKHYALYRQVYKVLILQQTAYWATMTWSYSDQVSMFYTLLRYVASYDSFDNFKKHTPEEHTEYYNSACCEELERHFEAL
jgi:hypothetical protein